MSDKDTTTQQKIEPKKLRKAVFPAAGLGTRFLPATKCMPKEMLTLVDKPLIQYAVEEALQAGIEEMIFVISRGKEMLKEHFLPNRPLEDLLQSRGKNVALSQLKSFEMKDSQIKIVYQDEPLGLGHAVWCARELVANEPFAVISCDDVILAKTGCLAQMATAYQEKGGNMIAAENVPIEDTRKYGILDIGEEQGNLASIHAMVEKPDPQDAPSTLSIRGRYILQPEIFAELEKKERGAGGEIQLTDAMAKLIGKQAFHALRFDGDLFDCGDKLGFIKATIAYAKARDDLNKGVSQAIAEYL